MINAIAVDDEPLALQVVRALCGRVPFINLAETFTGPAAALRYLEEHPVDLLFLDINMPGLSGIDLYKGLPEKQPLVIFTTAHSEYAVEGFNVKAVDFLLKPFTFERFQQAADKARSAHEYRQTGAAALDESITVRADYSHIRVALRDIIYVEGLDNYLKIHLTGKRPLLVRMSMKSLLEKLPEDQFMRVHRSYIVPLRGVHYMRNRVIYLQEGVEIPVGTNYTAEVAARFGESS